MNRKNNLLVMAVLIALSAAGVAIAADTAGKPAHPALDANGDGVVDKAEAAKFPGFSAHFDQIDTNHDGALSKDELQAARAQFRGQREHRGPGFAGGERGGFDGPRGGFGAPRGFGFAKFDADHDGKITRAEADAAASKRVAELFERFDANRDGVIDQSDRDALKAQREKKIAERRDDAFAKADANHDGKLSKAEFEAIKPAFGEGFGPRGPRPDGAAPAK